MSNFFFGQERTAFKIGNIIWTYPIKSSLFRHTKLEGFVIHNKNWLDPTSFSPDDKGRKWPPGTMNILCWRLWDCLDKRHMAW